MVTTPADLTLVTHQVDPVWGLALPNQGNLDISKF